MTMESDPPASDAQGIGTAFVKQFYTVLHNDPTQAYKFYQDLSVLSRPGPNGVMKSVTTVKVSFYLQTMHQESWYFILLVFTPIYNFFGNY